MIFRPELADQIMRGEKTVTRRLCSDNPRSPWWREKCSYTPGKVFAVQPGRGKSSIGSARVLRVYKEPLGRVSLTEAKGEGFDSVAAFRAAWRTINGSFRHETVVWRVEFELVDRGDG